MEVQRFFGAEVFGYAALVCLLEEHSRNRFEEHSGFYPEEFGPSSPSQNAPICRLLCRLRRVLLHGEKHAQRAHDRKQQTREDTQDSPLHDEVVEIVKLIGLGLCAVEPTCPFCTAMIGCSLGIRTECCPSVVGREGWRRRDGSQLRYKEPRIFNSVVRGDLPWIEIRVPPLRDPTVKKQWCGVSRTFCVGIPSNSCCVCCIYVPWYLFKLLPPQHGMLGRHVHM